MAKGKGDSDHLTKKGGGTSVNAGSLSGINQVLPREKTAPSGSKKDIISQK